MHKISSQLQDTFARNVTSIATCWQIKFKTGVVMGFTNMDVDLEVDGIKYSANSGFYPGSLYNSKRLGEDDFEAYGILDHELIKEKDILAGVYDNASIMIFLVDYLNPAFGKVIIRSGYIGDVQVNGQQFVAKCGLMQACDKEVGELYSPLCRAKFGDARCKVCQEDYTATGVVEEVLSEVKFSDSKRIETANYFAFGEITFLTGANAGQTSEIRSSSLHTIELMLPFYEPMQVNDSYTLITGCDKQFSTCIEKFNNALNFRGEPHIPQPNRISLW